MADLLRADLQSSLGTAYTLDRELPGGGMSRVFVARDASLGRDVVVKVLASEVAEGLSIERFAREIRLAAALQEPHIVPVLSAGTTSEGLPYYTMPYVRGESLRERMRSGPMSLATAVGVLRDVARALACAHAAGVVHRDIKPENVLLSSSTAMVTDFGIAKAVSASRTSSAAATEDALTLHGTALGTPAYMAPEQAVGDPVDSRADLYAWGVVAYELLANRHPFAAHATAQQLIAAHVSESPPELRNTAPEVPTRLATLVMSCLAKDPSARPATAEIVLSTLETISLTGSRTPMRLVRLRVVGPALLTLGFAGWIAIGSPRWRQGQAVAGHLPAITVLPFENLSGDSASTYLSDGMTEEMLGVLERTRAVRVASRATTFSYRGKRQDPKQVAAVTGSDAVLTGSVRRSGDRLRVVAELARGSDGERMWGETYERSLSDVFLIHEEIARAIASSLRVTLAPHAPPPRVEPGAYDAYLRAKQLDASSAAALLPRRKTLERMAALLEQAVAEDTTFARGWAQLGRAYIEMADFVPAPTVLPKAKECIRRAVHLDPTDWDVTLSHATILLNYDWDWEGAEREYRRAIAIDPQSAQSHGRYADLLAALRRSEEAMRETRLANALEWQQATDTTGLRARQLIRIAGKLAQAGRWREARSDFTEALRLAPNDARINYSAGVWLATVGDTAGAVRALEVARSRLGDRMPLLAFVGLAYGMAGHRDSTRRILADVERRARSEYFPKDQIAGLYLGLGDRARTLRAYEQAIDEHHWWMPYVNNDSWAPYLRDEPEFRRLMKRLNVPDASL
jgi:eukaryotic-like serine/threonine-protein kinase